MHIKIHFNKFSTEMDKVTSSFSEEGKRLLYDYLTDWELENEPLELDPVEFNKLYAEYETLEDASEDLGREERYIRCVRSGMNCLIVEKEDIPIFSRHF